MRTVPVSAFPAPDPTSTYLNTLPAPITSDNVCWLQRRTANMHHELFIHTLTIGYRI
ncbi:hypothetical protein ACZ87_03728 [Candidatus Erwinia dacicola]|uniref:Uncharacterized protein n=1 Tax=Candidatus Erwinia dacicola TaxID=252393 RepID=A0A328TKG6_9GAMM|nr:hypothetical protein ACZ87_03728 [Candidatus Erwinia dacicola]